MLQTCFCPFIKRGHAVALDDETRIAVFYDCTYGWKVGVQRWIERGWISGIHHAASGCMESGCGSIMIWNEWNCCIAAVFMIWYFGEKVHCKQSWSQVHGLIQGVMNTSYHLCAIIHLLWPCIWSFIYLCFVCFRYSYLRGIIELHKQYINASNLLLSARMIVDRWYSIPDS